MEHPTKNNNASLLEFESESAKQESLQLLFLIPQRERDMKIHGMIASCDTIGLVDVRGPRDGFGIGKSRFWLGTKGNISPSALV
jgi:hypothetical protein